MVGISAELFSTVLIVLGGSRLWKTKAILSRASCPEAEFSHCLNLATLISHIQSALAIALEFVITLEQYVLRPAALYVLLRAISALTILFLGLSLTLAQEQAKTVGDNGAINGTVTDPTEAVVADAKVVLTNVAD